MNNKFDNENKSNILDIAMREFETRHPRESWPEWFTKCMIIRGYESNNNRLIKITLRHKIQLKPNQYWKEIRGHRVLVNTDPITGKERIVICGGPEVDVEVIFEIDIASGFTKIITDTDIDLLDGTKYELNNC